MIFFDKNNLEKMHEDLMINVPYSGHVNPQFH